MLFELWYKKKKSTLGKEEEEGQEAWIGLVLIVLIQIKLGFAIIENFPDHPFAWIF